MARILEWMKLWKMWCEKITRAHFSAVHTRFVDPENISKKKYAHTTITYAHPPPPFPLPSCTPFIARRTRSSSSTYVHVYIGGNGRDLRKFFRIAIRQIVNHLKKSKKKKISCRKSAKSPIHLIVTLRPSCSVSMYRECFVLCAAYFWNAEQIKEYGILMRSLFPDCRRIFNTAFIAKRFLLGRSLRPPFLCRIIVISPPPFHFSPPPSSRIRANISFLFANNHIEHSFISHPFDSIVIAVFLSLFVQPNAISAAITNTLSVAQFTM